MGFILFFLSYDWSQIDYVDSAMMLKSLGYIVHIETCI